MQFPDASAAASRHMDPYSSFDFVLDRYKTQKKDILKGTKADPDDAP